MAAVEAVLLLVAADDSAVKDGDCWKKDFSRGEFNTGNDMRRSGIEGSEDEDNDDAVAEEAAMAGVMGEEGV